MFPEDFWEERTNEFKHIKSIPVRTEQVLELAADLHAALLFRGWVSELVYMQRCWPPNCFQQCGSWWIQMCGEHGEDELNNSLVVLLVQRNPIPLLQPFPLTLPWTWDCPVRETGGDVAMATTAVGQVGFLIESGGSSLTGQRGGGGNDGQAKPIKHEVECESMQHHCSTNISGTHTQPFHAAVWFCSLMNQ